MMLRVLRPLLATSVAAAFWLFLPTHPAAQTSPGTVSIPQSLRSLAPGGPSVRVIVGIDPRAAEAGAQAAMLSQFAAASGSLIPFETIPYVAMEVSPDDLDRLASQPGIVSIEEDVRLEPLLAQTLPLIGAPQAWSAGQTGAGWTVAVLDSGMQSTHPAFGGRVVSQACYSTHSPSQLYFSTCPGSATLAIGPGSGEPCGAIIAGCDHGTHVGGIAASVAPGAGLISIKVGTHSQNGNSVFFFFSDVIRGLERVYALRTTYNIASANLSIGGGLYTTTCDATFPSMKAIVDTLASAGIATVVASGNDGRSNALAAPSCVSTAISVGNTTKQDSVAASSNSASFLRLLAPGTSVLAAVPLSTYGLKTGTSMSAPHVAGAWALMKAARPAASVAQVLTALELRGAPVQDPKNGLTKPRIKLDSAVNFLHWWFATARTPTVMLPADYDGDSRADIAIYRNSNGAWFVRRSADGSLFNPGWGAPSLQDRPVPADYDGDGEADVAVYRASTGEWLIHRSTDGGLTYGVWGAPALSDVPVPADYDGDNRVDIAIFREATGQWYIAGSSAGGTVSSWGAPTLGDLPVPADYDGDGRADIAVYRGSTGEWFIARSAGGATTVNWGAPSLADVPVPADYDGDGLMDIAVYRGATGEWLVANSSGGSVTMGWGAPSFLDVPVPADYDGDGRADVGVYRSTTGEWLIRLSSNGSLAQSSWGAPTLLDLVRGL